MKRINLVLISLAIALSGLFVSCSDDDSEDTTFDKPSIDVMLAGTDVTGTTIEKEENTALEFEVKFTMGVAEDKLVKVKITSTIGGKSFNVLDSALNDGLFNAGDKEFIYVYKTRVGSAEEKISFYTEDKKARSIEESVTIKSKAVSTPGDFVSREAILMGSYANASLGSAYSVDLNKVLSLSAGFSQQSAVDMFYFYGSENKATLAAPSEADLTKVFTSTTTGLAKWSTKNATKFVKVTSITDFAALTTAQFDAAVATLGTGIKVNQLANGNILAFETVGGKKGLIKIDQITEGSNGSIKITIKMKK